MNAPASTRPTLRNRDLAVQAIERRAQRSGLTIAQAKDRWVALFDLAAVAQAQADTARRDWMNAAVGAGSGAAMRLASAAATTAYDRAYRAWLDYASLVGETPPSSPQASLFQPANGDAA